MNIYEHDDALRSMIRRARLLKVDDSGPQQLVDLMGLAGDMPKKVFRPQPHGFSSNPPANADGLMLALGGRSDRPVYLDGGHKDYRPKATPSGAAVLYDDKGNVIFVKGTNGIQISAKSGNVTVKPEGGKFVFLGGDGSDGGYDFVMTAAGQSVNVKAKIA
jgi:phage gp45-like